MKLYKVKKLHGWMFLSGIAAIIDGLVLVVTLGHLTTNLHSLAIQRVLKENERLDNTRAF